MKLLLKISLFYILIALIVFSTGGIIAFQQIQYEVQRETEFSLIESYIQLKAAIKNGVPIENLKNDKIDIRPVDILNPVDTNFVYSDTLAMHPLMNRMETFRKLNVTRRVGEQFYHFSIMDVFIELDDIDDIAGRIMSRLFIYLGICLVITSLLISRWLLNPFKKTMEKIRSFSLKSDKELDLPVTSTSEFQQLNTFLTQMTDKARQDYRLLKEFSENASHEMQTPLAVANGKLELLMESQDFSSQQLELLQSTQHALSRLSRLGEALLLLTKIENREFTSQDLIDFSQVVRNNLASFTEIADLRGLEVRSRLEDKVMLKVDPTLADILLSNLLKNAIKYNLEDGWIEVELNRKSLSISNPGRAPSLPPDQFFTRFRKGEDSGSSLGLGLSIVQKICEGNNWDIHYTFSEGIHQIQVAFRND